MAQSKRTSSAARTTKGSRAKAAPEPERETILSRHRRDLWIVAAATIGALLVLACWFGSLGPVGHGVDEGLGRLIGWARYLVPLGLIAAAVVMLTARRDHEAVRTAVGGSLVLVAICGLADLAAGQPGVAATGAALSSAGGWVGVGVGGSIAGGIGAAGTAVVLVAAAVIGIVLATGTTITKLATSTATWSVAAARHLATWWAGGALVRGARGATDDADADADDAGLDDGLDDEPGDADDDDATADRGRLRRTRGESFDAVALHRGPSSAEAPTGEVPAVAAASAPVADVVHAGGWTLPDPRLLVRTRVQRHDQRAVEASGLELVEALAAHGVDTQLVGCTVGPTVTRFELELGAGVKVARVTSLSKDIAYAMASPDVRILAPIPGRSAIGVEVPNQRRTLVTLGDLLATPEAAAASHPLDVALGRDISGRPVFVSLAEMPHVLISGATGAGKSSCINALVTSLVMRATPDQVRLILVDPKRVELGQYNDLPHLLGPVVVDPKKAAGALNWAVREMERRYDLLASHSVRDIAGYNEALARGELTSAAGPSVAAVVAGAAARAEARREGREPPVVDDEPAESLPFIVVVVDELNDLMMVAARDVEESVVRIAQMARAVGIHLVLATQRPSVDVITGVIKANIPSRMAFAVSSLADSRVILDQQGAERLIGKGDMLLLTANSNVARRIQSPWVSEDEVREVVASWRRQGRVDEPVVAADLHAQSELRGAGSDDDDDELLRQARELVVRSGLGSTSMLQRKLRVGFARAGRLMDLLEREGVVGPSEGSKARAVLVHPDELDYDR